MRRHQTPFFASYKVAAIINIAFCILLISGKTKAQYINLPDPVFKSWVLAHISHPSNSTEITPAEAAVYTGSINVYNVGISSLVGIEAFTAITDLNCSYNQLTGLNVSDNTALTSLSCYHNQLTNLNMQNGKNNKLAGFTVINNPNLTCIQVDNSIYMNTVWPNAKDATASYSANCIAGISDYFISNDITAFPEITTGTINFSDFCNVILTDITGKIILEKQKTNSLDISSQRSGIYFILMTNNLGQTKRSRVTRI